MHQSHKNSLPWFTLCLFSWISQANAAQPVFGMMPRWDDGWGFEIIEKYHVRHNFILPNDEVYPNYSESIHILHLAAVYTFDKSIRITAQLPIVLYAQRHMPTSDTENLFEDDQGLGALTLAVPLKKYFNLDGRSGSWTAAPQLRFPLEPLDEYEIYNKGLGIGIGLGYETETYRFKFISSASYWFYMHQAPDEVSIDVKLGFNFYFFKSNGHVLWNNHVNILTDGSITVSTGATLYWRFSDLFHGQFQWLHDYYTRTHTARHGNGDLLSLGVGLVF